MTNNTNSGGAGIGGLLLVLFVGLKLTGYISWSWLRVLSPVWLPFCVILAVVLVLSFIKAVLT